MMTIEKHAIFKGIAKRLGFGAKAAAKPLGQPLTRVERIAKRSQYSAQQAPARAASKAKIEIGGRAEKQRIERLARRGKKAVPIGPKPAPKPAVAAPAAAPAAPTPRIGRVAVPVAAGAAGLGVGIAGTRSSGNGGGSPRYRMSKGGVAY